MKHLACVRWALVAGAVGYAMTTGVSWAQEPAVAVVSDPTASLIVELVKGGGLPAVLAVAAWWARGAVGAGIPVVVQLSAEDRTAIRDLTSAVRDAARRDATDPGVR